MNMNLDQKTIDLFSEMMCSPEKMGIEIKPLKEVFVKHDQITPNDELYKQYIDYLDGRTLPKVIFYIVMRQVFGVTYVYYTQDDKGNRIASKAGYFLKFNEELK